MSHTFWCAPRLRLVVLCAVAMLCAGCSLQSGPSLPFGISAPVYRLAGPDDLCSVGGVFFDFYNKSEKEVVFIKACMNIYDSGGGLAFDGAAGLSCGAECSVAGGARKSLCVELDLEGALDHAGGLDHVGESDSAGASDLAAGAAGFVVDGFYISRIKYADGSLWEDKYGFFGGVNENSL